MSYSGTNIDRQREGFFANSILNDQFRDKGGIGWETIIGANSTVFITPNGKLMIPVALVRDTPTSSLDYSVLRSISQSPAAWVVLRAASESFTPDANANIENEAKKHLRTIYAFDGEQDVKALSYLFDVIETALADSNLLLLDFILENIDLNRTRQIIYVGLLRGTYRVNSKLDSWKPLLDRVSEFLENQGKDSSWILRGLLEPDAGYSLTSESRT